MIMNGRNLYHQPCDFCNIIGKSPVMEALYNMLAKVARRDLTVLITGPTGTGKELAARAVHELSPRRDRPLVTIHCGAFPENLLEGELFGHCKGAFTGAVRERKGRFEEADGGTVFLDEIGELSLAMQVKLLRVLQFKTFERLGANQPVRVDVRLIAATHKDLKQGVADGWFREDLYYRLNVVPIEVPRLQERREDIPLLVDHFLDLHGGTRGRSKTAMTPEALAALTQYHFPGNVRELENIVQRMLAIAETPLIDIDAMPPEVPQGIPKPPVRNHRQDVDRKALSEALQNAVVLNHDGRKALWKQRLRCVKADDIETFLSTWGAAWFSRKRYTRFLEEFGDRPYGKYKTAGDHLAILRANHICVHNHEKANRAAHRLHRRFLFDWRRDNACDAENACRCDLT